MLRLCLLLHNLGQEFPLINLTKENEFLGFHPAVSGGEIQAGFEDGLAGDLAPEAGIEADLGGGVDGDEPGLSRRLGVQN